MQLFNAQIASGLIQQRYSIALLSRQVVPRTIIIVVEAGEPVGTTQKRGAEFLVSSV